MALPKKRHSKARRNKRRANWNLVLPGLTTCAQCGRVIPPHRVCPGCGSYRGRQVVSVAKDEEKA
jgi:large subunit ribosomal protein L32